MNVSIVLAVVILGQTLTYQAPKDTPCEDFATIVELLAAIEPAHRLGTAQRWTALAPSKRQAIVLAYNYLESNAVTQQSGYTLAYRECAI